MFTGIVQAICQVVKVESKQNLTRYAVTVEDSLMAGLKQGASISIDGVCLTVVGLDPHHIWFEAIQETLQRTTLRFLKQGHTCNFERSAHFGDEIGGHMLSGHIYGTALIKKMQYVSEQCIIELGYPTEWAKYLFPKGYIAINGVSLTLVEVKPEGTCSIHLIPETLKRTTFKHKKEGDLVNLEFDAHTQAIVDTIERIYANKSTS